MATFKYTVLDTRKIGSETIFFVLFEQGSYGTVTQNRNSQTHSIGDNDVRKQKESYYREIKQLKKKYIQEFSEQGGLEGIEEVWMLAEEICREL